MSEESKPAVGVVTDGSIDGVPKVVEVLPEKGMLNSKTVTSVLWMVGLAILDAIVQLLFQNSEAVRAALLAITPDMIDPIASSVYSAILNGLSLAFGARAIKGRKEIGDLTGLYRKPSVPTTIAIQ